MAAARPTARLASLIQQAVLAGDEQLDWLIEGWYGPFFARVRESTSGESQPSPDQAALIMALDSLILGYVTLAPLHARLLERDPLGDEALDAHASLLRDLMRATRPG